MTWTWASVDALWRSPSLSPWIALAAAVLFAVFIIVVLIRADKSVANGALALITVAAIGVAVATTVRGPIGSRRAPTADQVAPAMSLAAMSCLDGLAGDAVEAACERPLFASAESSAAAVSYTAGQLNRLAAAAAGSADKKPPPEFMVLRRALERDRYGLAAHVLATRDGCTPSDCAFYAFLGDHNQIAANMSERAYEGLIGRYALGWNNSAAQAPAPAPVASPASMPTGKPLSGDFPSSSSIPPVNIMSSEPGPGATAGVASAAKPAAAAPARPPAPTAPAAPKKLTPKKPPPPPPPPSPPPAPAPVAPAPPPSSDN